MRVLGRPIRPSIVTVLVLATALLLAVGVVAGCSGSTTTATASGQSVTAPTARGSGSTTTTKAGASVTRTSSTSVVQGDKTVEEYQAELPGLEAKAKATPDDKAVLQDLATAYYMVDRVGDAAAVYEQMLKLGETPTMRNNYGNMLRDMGKTEEAKAAYTKALADDPKLVVAYVNLAGQLVREGNMDEAMKVLDGGIATLQGADKTRLEAVKTALQKAQ